MNLAKSYLDEVEKIYDKLESGDKNIKSKIERLLDQGWEQIQNAEQIDPNVSLETYDIKEAKLNYYYFKGHLEYIKRDYNDAIFYLKPILEIDPDFDIVYALLSTCYFKIGEKEDAINNIKRAIELKPTNKDYKEELNRMIESQEIRIPLSEQETELRSNAKKSIFISILFAFIGGICGLMSLTSEQLSRFPKPIIPIIFIYIFWATYWGWKIMHRFFKKVISSISPKGCFIVMPIMYWITIIMAYIFISKNPIQNRIEYNKNAINTEQPIQNKIERPIPSRQAPTKYDKEGTEPSKAEDYEQLVESYNNSHEYDKALDYIQRRLQLEPNNADLYYEVGVNRFNKICEFQNILSKSEIENIASSCEQALIKAIDLYHNFPEANLFLKILYGNIFVKLYPEKETIYIAYAGEYGSRFDKIKGFYPE